MEQVSHSAPLFESRLRSLKKIHQGKVRDIYDVDDQHLLIVATDRLSAFDVVLPDPIPFKGQVLTQISLFWFGKTAHIAPNHLSDLRIEDIVSDAQERAQLEGRAMVVKKLQALPLEAVVRGYLIGSGYKDYKAHGSICGIPLPAGLVMAARLPEPLFTPASKAPAGATMRTSTSMPSSSWWARNAPKKFDALRSRFIASPPNTHARATSLSPIRNLNSASINRESFFSSMKR